MTSHRQLLAGVAVFRTALTGSRRSIHVLRWWASESPVYAAAVVRSSSTRRVVHGSGVADVLERTPAHPVESDVTLVWIVRRIEGGIGIALSQHDDGDLDVPSCDDAGSLADARRAILENSS